MLIWDRLLHSDTYQPTSTRNDYFELNRIQPQPPNAGLPQDADLGQLHSRRPPPGQRQLVESGAKHGNFSIEQSNTGAFRSNTGAFQTRARSDQKRARSRLKYVHVPMQQGRISIENGRFFITKGNFTIKHFQHTGNVLIRLKEIGLFARVQRWLILGDFSAVVRALSVVSVRSLNI